MRYSVVALGRPHTDVQRDVSADAEHRPWRRQRAPRCNAPRPTRCDPFRPPAQRPASPRPHGWPSPGPARCGRFDDARGPRRAWAARRLEGLDARRHQGAVADLDGLGVAVFCTASSPNGAEITRSSASGAGAGVAADPVGGGRVLRPSASGRGLAVGLLVNRVLENCCCCCSDLRKRRPASLGADSARISARTASKDRGGDVGDLDDVNRRSRAPARRSRLLQTEHPRPRRRR